jgi:O-methyltransferase
MPVEAADLYLDLLKQCLTRLAFPDEYRPALSLSMPVGLLQRGMQPVLAKLHFGLYRRTRVDAAKRAAGQDWPAEAETMIGLARLDMLQQAMQTILQQDIPGDLVEAGAWRGGGSIFMRAVLKAYGDASRTVWVADSFEGLPKPDGRYPQDKGDHHWRYNGVLGVSLEEVKRNFVRYGLLDERVRFLPGWFKDTLPAAPIQRLALLRLDGDMYSSTMDALEALYPKLSPGGYAVIDDYGALPACRNAVEDFRNRYKIREAIETIDKSGVFWRKASCPPSRS